MKTVYCLSTQHETLQGVVYEFIIFPHSQQKRKPKY